MTMGSTGQQHRDLLLGLGFSCLVHVGAGLAFVRVPMGGGGVEPPAPELAVTVKTEEELEREVRPGIERSDAATENWLGFEAPTEHTAPESAVEQSAMALEEETRKHADEETERQRDEEKAAAREAAARALVASARGLADAWTEAVRAGVARLSEPPVAGDGSHGLPAAEGADVGETGVGGQTVAPEPVPSEGADSEATDDSPPGIVTDKEAVASALKAAPVVVPGRVVAAEGLEISTRRPQWSRTTRATARPRNPVMWITFGRDGRVQRAGFLSDGERVYNTGFQDVDEPLLNAVYRWTARGRALDELPPDQPGAGVTIRLRVLLVG